MKILIPGGAGYIGSHMVKLAQENNIDVSVIDNFSTGHRWAINDCELIDCDLLDKEKLAKSLKGKQYDGVIHFAAKSIVSESINNPFKYYHNNFVGTLNLVNELICNDIDNLVFSSTAAIFGNPPHTGKISEEALKNPINPYGRSKLMVEEFLSDLCKSQSFTAISLRYFNAAGAHSSANIGELHDPETHLIPNILNSVLDDNSSLKVFGEDYPTEDGTCIRDYIHVEDLANAHLLALTKKTGTGNFYTYNLGNGNGFSVKEVIESSKRVTGSYVKYNIESRRMGDPAILVANNSKIIKDLGWKIQYKELDSIISSAWNWTLKHRNLKT